jgi:hypothetical protein
LIIRFLLAGGEDKQGGKPYAAFQIYKGPFEHVVNLTWIGKVLMFRTSYKHRFIKACAPLLCPDSSARFLNTPSSRSAFRLIFHPTDP